MYYTDDPVADFENWDWEREEMLEKLPKCTHCGEPIQDEYLYNIDDELFCEECMTALFRKSTDLYIEEGD